MYCVIQQVMRKKPDPLGEYREIKAYPLEWSINDVPQVPAWRWEWSGGRFERPHLEAYKITIHQSYREGGKVRKRQYPPCRLTCKPLSGGGTFAVRPWTQMPTARL